MTDQEILEKACELKGHTFESTGVILTSNPPQYPERCKYCGKGRIGTPQDPFVYRYD